MSSPTVKRILVALKSYVFNFQLRNLTESIVSCRFLVALKATGKSALKIFGILVALKTIINRDVNSHC